MTTAFDLLPPLSDFEIPITGKYTRTEREARIKRYKEKKARSNVRYMYSKAKASKMQRDSKGRLVGPKKTINEMREELNDLRSCVLASRAKLRLNRGQAKQVSSIEVRRGRKPGCSPNRTKRIPLDRWQVGYMQLCFKENAYPRETEMQTTSELLGITKKQVYSWYAYMRFYTRKRELNQGSIQTGFDVSENGTDRLVYDSSSGEVQCAGESCQNTEIQRKEKETTTSCIANASQSHKEGF